MTIQVIEPGLQSTVQGLPRLGLRHLGVPASGAADPLSMALANRLVGNHLLAPALEITLTGISLRLQCSVSVAITGAIAECRINGFVVAQHQSLNLRAGDTLSVGRAEKGVRSYAAFSGGLSAENCLNSVSTYLPAQLGGFRGRALEEGDELHLVQNGPQTETLETPAEFRPPMLDSWTLRAGRSLETTLLSDPDRLFVTPLRIGGRNDRMGFELEGAKFDTRSDGRMPSAAVFPGIIQCPEDGALFLLSVDAQTTGGYPRVAKVCRIDLHLLGQMGTGNRLSFIERADDEVAAELRDKHRYWERWLPDIAEVI